MRSFGSWYGGQKGAVQAAVVGGVFVLVGGIVTGLFGIVNTELAKSGAQTATSPPAPAASSVGADITSTAPPAASQTGAITDPLNGATNIYKHEQLHVAGTAQNIPGGDRLDVFLQFSSYERYYAAADPNIAAPLINGHWSATIFIGEAKPIILWLVSLTPSEIDFVNSHVADQTAGFPTLPGTKLASVSFTARSATITISRPSDGGRVNYKNNDIFVRASDIRSNQQVWVVVRFQGSSTWFPQGPCTPSRIGEYECHPEFGDSSTEAGTPFQLYAEVIAARDAYNNQVYENGFDAAHPPVTPLRKSVTITVTRS
jgi:hypothetical protein